MYFEGKAGGGRRTAYRRMGIFPRGFGGRGGANGVQFPGEEGEAAYRLSGVLSGRGGLAYLLEKGGGGGGNAYRCTWLGRGGGGGGGSGTQDAICNICI